MFSSIQSRLWLSYTLLVGVVLGVVSIGLFYSFEQNPILYRQVYLRLRLAEAEILPKIEPLLAQSTADRQIERLLAFEASNRELRLALLRANNGQVIADVGSGAGSLPPLSRLKKNLNTDGNGGNNTFVDSRGQTWLYALRTIDEKYILIVATPRPMLQFLSVIRDEIVAPLLQAAGIALVVAFILGFFMARWISNPLLRIQTSSQELARGSFTRVPVEGPKEVQRLAQSLNEMSQQVQISDQAQRSLVANVSHELKTPLTSIQGFSQAILDGTAQTPESLQQAANIIYNEASRMHRLVIELLVLARLEGGTADLAHSEIDLTILLSSIKEKFELIAQQNQINLSLSIPEPVTLLGDGDRLAQVFTNLVDNAIKFTPASGSVCIQTERRPTQVWIDVIDSGVGIAPEEISKVFDQFYQVDKSRRGGANRGVGLGLTIAKQVVLAHGGSISVKSKPGQGSIFRVSLPLNQAAPVTPPTRHRSIH